MDEPPPTADLSNPRSVQAELPTDAASIGMAVVMPLAKGVETPEFRFEKTRIVPVGPWRRLAIVSPALPCRRSSFGHCSLAPRA
jgi:hypothetical protein